MLSFGCSLTGRSLAHIGCDSLLYKSEHFFPSILTVLFPSLTVSLSPRSISSCSRRTKSTVSGAGVAYRAEDYPLPYRSPFFSP